MISRALDYALRSCLYMASRSEKEFHSVKEISDALGVSQSYLGKILQKLVHKNYLKSITGPTGGFALAQPTNKITIHDLMLAIDGMKGFEMCVLGVSVCDELNPCPVHDTWKQCKDKMLKAFETTSIEEASRSPWPGTDWVRP